MRNALLTALGSLVVLVPVGDLSLFSQTGGAIRGTVVMEPAGTPMRHVTVTLDPSRRSTETGEDGTYEFTQVAPGRYTILAHIEGLPDVIRAVEVPPSGDVTADLTMRATGIRVQVTVTASGKEESSFDAFQSVTSLDRFDLVEKSHTSIGEVLEGQLGIAKRSFGPGTSRPVLRGFDGDRVLILKDGVQTGSLSSQSGDHGEPIDVLTLERLEVVKGPAALLYGSNAIGGVVNAITRHHQWHPHPHSGFRGSVTGVAGSADNQGGGGAGFEWGVGKWLIWGSGEGQRTGDYDTPEGEVDNSKTRSAFGAGGVGWYGEGGFLSAGYDYDDRRYGIPFAGLFEGEEDARIDVDMQRHNLKLTGGLHKPGSAVESVHLSFDYSDYRHRELEGEEVGTVFDNNQFVYRGVLQHKRAGMFSGQFGFWGLHRDYKTAGEEALAPPTTQNAFALFGLEELDLEHLSFQFGGRLEHNRYAPDGISNRSFTGVSAAAGIRVPLWKSGAFVANYSHSYRAPALEELYNNGPHVGNRTFEIGDSNLERETGDGLELSLRQDSEGVRQLLPLRSAGFHFSRSHRRDRRWASGR
jgi:iron complex outermembrane receptor protein